jgi:hypothetical protein
MTKSKWFAAVAAAFALGLGVSSGIDQVRNLSCNAECEAQLLCKNSVFYAARSAATNAQKTGRLPSLDRSVLESKSLRENGIQHVILLPTGAFVLTSRFGNLAMLATPSSNEGATAWNCEFFSSEAQTPKARKCSFE